MARTWPVSKAERVCCRVIKVFRSMLAPARSRKDAAICTTAKMRRRRLVPPVIRKLALASAGDCEALAVGRLGTYASRTAARIASDAPTQRMLESTVRSEARTENREA